MKDFRQLQVWDKAHALALAIYRITKSFPRDELYGLTSQIRRACTSIPTNISEGCGLGSDADLSRFLQISMGSASEVEYLLLLSHDLCLIGPADYEQLNTAITEVKRMLSGLIKTLKADR
jgi:four helix bundle protein